MKTAEWQIAIAQHPMYLLIREDTQCAERTPPWGAPSIEDYNLRLEDNLDALDRIPELKIGYEWSGYELELLAEDNPDLFARMCKLAKEGRATFYNGTYAQPHLQTLSSEASFRQFEYGVAVYRDMCDHPVRVYAHQEASVHDQVPQLLAAFDIKYSFVPQFSSTLKWLSDGELVLFATHGPRFVNGNEFVSWVGLDGTEVPLYLRQGNAPSDVEELTANEIIAGLQKIVPILVRDPDLVSIDEEWMKKHEGMALVLLDEALEERIKEVPPRSRARFYSDWSYIEGIRAEELSRTNREAERQVLRVEALEAMAFLQTGHAAESTRDIWREILGLQHHDVYCFCAPQLKGKAIDRLQRQIDTCEKRADATAESIISRMDLSSTLHRPLVLFGTTPHAVKTIVSLHTPLERPAILDSDGRRLSSETLPDGEGNTKIRFLAEMPGFGYQSFSISTDETLPAEETTLKAPHSFENDWYRAEIAMDGTFRSLSVGATELLAPGGEGNKLRATDTTGQSKRVAGGPADLRNKTFFTPPAAGPVMEFRPTSQTKIRESSLGQTVLVHGRLGDSVDTELEIHLYHDLPRIDIDWAFDFGAATSIGNFYDDYSKLTVKWPLAYTGHIHNDIAFGAVESRDERPIFPASWLDVSDNAKGLTYLHTGTLKHWISDNCLYNLFAWGENTDVIGSRMWRRNWSKAFDQRLDGKHTIHTAVYPHQGNWRSAKVVEVAGSFGAAPLAVQTEAHPGDLPPEALLMQVRDPGLVATSVRAEDDCVKVRAHALESPVTTDALFAATPHSPVLHSLKQERITKLARFEIGEYTM
jgi:alpha-mannosidase